MPSPQHRRLTQGATLPAAAPANPLPASSVSMPRPFSPPPRGEPAASPPRRPRSCRATLCRVVILLLAALVGLNVLSLFASDPDSPRPPALSPPAAPRGVGKPAYYAFTRLSVVPDLIAITMAMGQIGRKVHRLPCVQRGWVYRMKAALSDMEEPAQLLESWLYGKNFPGKPSASVEGRLAAEALENVENICRAAPRDLDRFRELRWYEMTGHAQFTVDGVLHDHFAEFKNSTWAFHPDEEDLGQYDDLDLVGNVNQHEAADLNRTAARFLSSLHKKRLPELMRFCNMNGPPFQTPPEEFAILKAKFDSMLKQVEELSSSDWAEAARAGLEQYGIWDGPKPGLLRRAAFWVWGSGWEYPCRQTPISWEAQAGEQEDYYWMDPSPAGLRAYRDRKYADPYYYASALRCLLASQRVIREEVLPRVRKSQTGLAEAQAKYEKQVAEASQRLKHQIAELVAGRGWEFVERVQIGLTSEGHRVELSRAEAKGIPLTDVRNTTVWKAHVPAAGQQNG
ncbi:predicted protein [Chaetomium globosum CBS 148.51]|uniref:Uncharacterized protein n=1 Tax=Chaetomium globosum (strain ATCC 6205 / CBS 148.51 / DSM 1962 / NBRC 6347 / NRRL 1970) TaxID=306901 RepID=Q2GRE1_CHAGB|nr:uncharacterized protein CHGG_09463 [Chaetomium globosum CBS 148.51]EAQ85449.1 predicted protein [Chaetomium globosum CBS 148.51]